MNTNPLTGQPLPSTAIQRILFIAPKVHIYQIPPLTSTKGYNAASWTADNNKRQIFTARLRILETSIPSSDPDDTEKVTTTLLLEDPGNGQLFAAAPYTNPATVEQALDSSRFFAVTVVGEGRKAVLGMGFEERSEAFDFSIALQDARRVLGMENPGAGVSERRSGERKKEVEEVKRDFSLKEGETISINFGGRGRRSRPDEASKDQKSEQDALFSIKPPPGRGANPAGAMPFLPPPPSAKSVKEERRRSRQTFEQKPQDLGFDDGEFGEFQ
ncbi:adaptin ear-binding coat-associated protein 1 NECAP-1 [Zopfia rhizophila CBS 207.26]|uniref:Adaptin ear-binding coat-associated protein 1 NECAP-1 n=1 Tax=Zopfia rhizophila CBS 207.26 TaxID=1314779 RepID=A0A6A6EBS8_9PEZI|nr:adaptin ear-binding coat-associated protein 1 NECAP-1 [Zopfia rhizophila CBS 207.26]